MIWGMLEIFLFNLFVHVRCPIFWRVLNCCHLCKNGTAMLTRSLSKWNVDKGAISEICITRTTQYRLLTCGHGDKMIKTVLLAYFVWMSCKWFLFMFLSNSQIYLILFHPFISFKFFRNSILKIIILK